MIEENVFFSNQEFILFSRKVESPFPFNLEYSWRVAIAIVSTIVLLLGIFFRALIIRYLLEPEAKLRPINKLIWIDQLNGVFSALNILGRIVAFFLPFPLRDLAGDSLCRWCPFPGKNNFLLTFTIDLVN